MPTTKKIPSVKLLAFYTALAMFFISACNFFKAPEGLTRNDDTVSVVKTDTKDTVVKMESKDSVPKTEPKDTIMIDTMIHHDTAAILIPKEKEFSYFDPDEDTFLQKVYQNREVTIYQFIKS